jgi:hypothetical protein
MILSIPDEILYRLDKIRHKWVEVELLSDHHYATFIIFILFFLELERFDLMIGSCHAITMEKEKK